MATEVLPRSEPPAREEALRTWGLVQGLRARGHEVEASVPRDAAGRVHELQPDAVLCGDWRAATFPARITQPLVIDLAGPPPPRRRRAGDAAGPVERRFLHRLRRPAAAPFPVLPVAGRGRAAGDAHPHHPDAAQSRRSVPGPGREAGRRFSPARHDWRRLVRRSPRAARERGRGPRPGAVEPRARAGRPDPFDGLPVVGRSRDPQRLRRSRRPDPEIRRGLDDIAFGSPGARARRDRRGSRDGRPQGKQREPSRPGGVLLGPRGRAAPRRAPGGAAA